jgi:hypothetical protein
VHRRSAAQISRSRVAAAFIGCSVALVTFGDATHGDRGAEVTGIDLPTGDCAAVSGQLDGQVAGFVGLVAACSGAGRNERDRATRPMKARMPLSVRASGIAHALLRNPCLVAAS